MNKLYERDKRLSDTFIHKEYEYEPEILVGEVKWAINELANENPLEQTTYK